MKAWVMKSDKLIVFTRLIDLRSDSKRKENQHSFRAAGRSTSSALQENLIVCWDVPRGSVL